MNPLIEKLPKTVWIGDIEYPICTDFRVSIAFEQLMLDVGISENDKMMQALTLYFGKETIPIDINTALEALIAFYRCDPVFDMQATTENNGQQERRVYDFERDFEYIYAAFLDQYHIDLYEMRYLHWWKFKALFKSLKEDTQMMKIIGYRCAKVEKGMSSEQKSEIHRLHRVWDLPISQVDQDQEDDFLRTILGDAYVDTYLKVGDHH